jgi:outer membrane immunogenic protein
MKHVLVAAAGLSILGSGTVFAADIAPYRAVPVAAPVAYDWTGLYFGGHIGGGWEKTRSNDDSWNVINFPGGAFFPAGGPANMNNTSSSFLGGLQAGYNYQIGRLVLGSEFEWSWTSLSNQAAGGFPFGPAAGAVGAETFGTSNRWIGTATTRLGVAKDNWLYYGKIGGAWTGSDYTLGAIQTGPGVGGGRTTLGGTFSETRVGWTLGTGIEWAFAANWTAKLEYDYMNFGSSAVTIPVGIANPGTGPLAGNVNANVNQSISELKFGVNYKMAPGFLFW